MSVTVGVRELKENLSEYLSRVEAGETVTVTKRGRAIASIVPSKEPLEVRMRRLADAGILAWNGERLPHYRPTAVTRGPRTVADLLIEDRE